MKSCWPRDEIWMGNRLPGNGLMSMVQTFYPAPDKNRNKLQEKIKGLFSPFIYQLVIERLLVVNVHGYFETKTDVAIFRC
jgi:hypothetical protein